MTYNLKPTISSIIVFLSTVLINTNQDCLLKVAKNQNDLFQRKSIFENGQVHPDWSKSTANPYSSPQYMDIEYFYIMEEKPSPHEDIIVSPII